jgi:hypothetical protein
MANVIDADSSTKKGQSFMESEEKQALVKRSEEDFYTFRGKPVRVLGYGLARAHIYVTFEEQDATALIGTTEWDAVAYVAKYEQGAFAETDIDVEGPHIGDRCLITEGPHKGKIGRVAVKNEQACVLVVETNVAAPLSALALVRRR